MNHAMTISPFVPQTSSARAYVLEVVPTAPTAPKPRMARSLAKLNRNANANSERLMCIAARNCQKLAGKQTL